MRRTQLLCFAMAMLALPSIALAGSAAPAVIPDTFTPTSVVQTINVGQSFDVTKTFTIGARDADTPVDIMFLFDTTNSFGPYFTDPTWAATAASLVSQATGKFNDVRFAIGQYEDFDTIPWGASGDSEYSLLHVFSGNAAATTTALQGITTGVGGDDPESNLVALNAAAGEGWRSDSVRILVWVGDQPGHVPGEKGTGPGAVIVTYPGTVDTDDVIAALTSGDILVEGFDFGSTSSLDGDLRDMNGAGALLDTGQATAITGQTGGDLWTVTTGGTAAVGLASLLSLYGTALDEAFALYNLGLDVSNLPAGLSLSIVPPGSTSGDRTTLTPGTSETYQWVLTFTGDNPGVYTFPIYGMLDGKILGTELDRITVLRGGTPPPEIPEPTTFALLGLGLLGVGFAARRRKK